MSMKVKHWQDVVNLIAGLWLIASPWALAFQAEPTPTWNAVIFGVLIALVALYALYQVFAWQEWANIVLGAWVVVSPWLLGFSAMTAAMANAVVVGAVVLGLAFWALATDKDIGGWWSPAH